MTSSRQRSARPDAKPRIVNNFLATEEERRSIPDGLRYALRIADLAGFGWCRMPEHIVAEQIAAKKLVRLRIEDDPAPRDALTIYAAHRRDQLLGPAGRWLLETLQTRLSEA